MDTTRHPASYSQRLFPIACLLAALPLWFSTYPPMVDIAQHAAQISTLNRLHSPAFSYADLFYLNWGTPYLGGYMLLWALSQFLPLLTALKVLLGLTMAAIPFTASRLRAHFGGDPQLDWLLLPIGYGFAFQWGFLNFLVGIPLVFIFLLYAFRYIEKPAPRAGVVLAVCAILLIAAHLLIAAFACGLALLFVLASPITTRQKVTTALPFLSPLPLAVIWLALRLAEGGQTTEDGPWRLSWLRPLQFFASAIGLPSVVYLYMLLGFIVFALPFLLGARVTSDKRRLALFASLMVWMLFGPDYFLGNYFTYNRFAVFGLPLFLLILEMGPPRFPEYHRLIRSMVFAMPVVLVLSTCLRFASFEHESKDFRAILPTMSPHSRAVGLMLDNTSTAFSLLPLYLHFASWYQAESYGIADYSFSHYVVLVKYRPEAAIPIPRGFEWTPELFNWAQHQGWVYDYFIVRAGYDPTSQLFGGTDCAVTLVQQRGMWWLYQRKPGILADAKSCTGTHPDAESH